MTTRRDILGREQMTYNLATNKVEPLMIRGRCSAWA